MVTALCLIQLLIFAALLLLSIYPSSAYEPPVAGSACQHNNGNAKKEMSVGSGAEKPSWAIVMLAMRKKSADIKERNAKIAEKIAPFAKEHNVTVVVYSEEKFGEKQLLEWQSTFRGVARVEFVNTASNGFEGPNSGRKTYGYKYMCKFFSIDLFDHLSRGGYDYYMRVDSDCNLAVLNYGALIAITPSRFGRLANSEGCLGKSESCFYSSEGFLASSSGCLISSEGCLGNSEGCLGNSEGCLTNSEGYLARS
jgi:hypothetical protein